MVGKLWSLIAAAAVVGLLAAPAEAATKAKTTAAKPAATKTAAAKPADSSGAMHHHRAMGCYDYAWESQEMKNCLAKKAAAKPAGHKRSAKKPAA